MPQKAHITSVEALEHFRSTLIVYLGKARPVLEEVSAEVVRTRGWIENDQRTRWEAEAKRRAKLLEQAQAALFSARISNLRKDSTAEQLAFHRAKRAMEEADIKLRTIKKWSRDFDSRVEPLVKQTEKLHTVFANDMVKAVAYLAEAIKTLAAYSEAAPPGSTSTPAPAAAEG